VDESSSVKIADESVERFGDFGDALFDRLHVVIGKSPCPRHHITAKR